MAATMVDVQPVSEPKDTQVQEAELPNEDLNPEQDEEHQPTEKSGVRINRNAPDQSSRFNKGDIVHMSLIENGMRMKGVFKVSEGQIHPSGAWWEYQIVDATGRPFQGGTWVRENKLRLQERAR